jgi:hypothetical protein
MQCLAEDRWEDYQWTYDQGRFAYWNKGFSWIERPDMDQIGLQAQRSIETMTTLPTSTSDLAFYICKAESLTRAEMQLNGTGLAGDIGEAKPTDADEMGTCSNGEGDEEMEVPADRFCITVPV